MASDAEKLYTDKELREISRDPERLRRYFSGVAMNARRQALKDRRKSRQMGLAYPVTGYRAVFEEGRDLLHWAETMDRFADVIVENIDALVASTLEMENRDHG
jgi:hypothetical protein